MLRLGIVLYATRLTFQDIEQFGTSGILIDVVMIGSTLGLMFLARRRVMLLDRDMVWPVGAGSAICGAAAVLEIEPVLKARTAQVSVAVATVVVFGTLSTFVYPLLYRVAGEWRSGELRGGRVYGETEQGDCIFILPV